MDGKICDTVQRIFSTVLPKHGLFDVWFCLAAGKDFTKDDLEYLKELQQSPNILPLPIYIALLNGDQESLKDLKDNSNLHFVQGKECVKVMHICGLKVAIAFGESFEADTTSPVDILFTWDQPPSLSDRGDNSSNGSKLDLMTAALAPRYHFAIGRDIFWEREPYESVIDGIVRPCRFFSLANSMNLEQKWMYAMNLKDTIDALPPKMTPNPFIQITLEPSKGPNYFFQLDPSTSKRSLAEIQQAALEAAANNSSNIPTRSRKPPPGYACKQCMDTTHFYRSCPHRVNPLRRGNEPDPEQPYICHKCHKPGHPIRSCPLWLEEPTRNSSNETSDQSENPVKRHKPAKSSEPCWFCLGNPKVRKHLIIDVGTEAYLALARGPLIKTHMLLVPIDHINEEPSSTTNPSLFEQIYEKYIGSLREQFSRQKDAQHLITWSHSNSKGQHHWHLQLLTIPTSTENVEERIIEISRNLGYPLTKEPKKDLSSFEMTVYLVNGQPITLSHTINTSAYFPVQFGRQLMAHLLGMANNLDWRDSQQSDEQEIRMVTQLKRDLKSVL